MSRVAWESLPSGLHKAVAERTGDIEKAEIAETGVMSQLACAITCAEGRIFLKGVPAEASDAWIYRNEAVVTRNAPSAPQVLWEMEAEGWFLVAYEFLEGQHANLEPGSPDLDALAKVLETTSRFPWPDEVRKKPLSSRLGPFLPQNAGPVLEGGTLGHTDMSPLNMMVTQNGLRLIDWALACPSPSWTDTAFAVPRLIDAGHSPDSAEDFANRVSSYASAPNFYITTFAEVVSTAWDTWSKARPNVNRENICKAARTWASYRRDVYGLV